VVKQAWAKLPTAWLNVNGPQPCPLAALQWQGYRSTGQAALLLLMGLTIRRNQSLRGQELDAPCHQVAVTYDDLQDLAGVARGTVAKAIAHLEAWGAIKVQAQGRRSVYELCGLERAGGWCQLPQARLLNSSGTGLAPFRGNRANRNSLNAMKLYVLLMAKRYQRLNTAAVSYMTMTQQAGVRREDIPNALQQLIALGLVSLAPEKGDGREDVDGRTQRYVIEGLKRV